jgi:hypothetical protein
LDPLALTRIEADYIVTCQDANLASPSYGAFNDVSGQPTWVVPSENAMAILGLVMASRVLGDPNYLAYAQLAADYLVRVQDANDGAWCNQYKYAAVADPAQSPRQTAEVMIALNKLGPDPNRYTAMARGAQYLMSCQQVTAKGGAEDGLLGGGKDASGKHQGWRWTHDNAYSYWALRAAEIWATRHGDPNLAVACGASSQRILDGINSCLYSRTTGVWHIAVDASGQPQWPSHLKDVPTWIQCAPQMLDVPAYGVNSPRVGQWIHTSFQQTDGSCIETTWDNSDNQLTVRKYPGFTFQAVLCWLDTGHADCATSALSWCHQSGLWQVRPDTNHVAGGWIDWQEVTPSAGKRAPTWQRFIDTSFYAIAAYNGGYDFTVAAPVPGGGD